MSQRPAMQSEPLAQSLPTAAWSRLCDYLVLTKARLSLLVLAATAAGYALAARQTGFDLAVLFHALIGTALVAFGAGALNQVFERDADARMNRTHRRPIPAGRMSVDEAVYFGVGAACVGTIYLLILTTPLAAALAALTLLLYVFAYTPLKRISTLNLTVGAVPGAIPPLIGYAAATGALTPEALLPAMVVFFWQYPHFLAISWLYRDDYARGGFAMLAVHDETGERVARQIISRTIMLMIVTLMPAAFGVSGHIYAVAALIANALFFVLAVQMARSRTAVAARRLFIASIVYLPVLLVLLVMNPGRV